MENTGHRPPTVSTKPMNYIYMATMCRLHGPVRFATINVRYDLFTNATGVAYFSGTMELAQLLLCVEVGDDGLGGAD